MFCQIKVPFPIVSLPVYPPLQVQTSSVGAERVHVTNKKKKKKKKKKKMNWEEEGEGEKEEEEEEEEGE